MNIGILIPGFGANENDWALPIYQNLVRELAHSHHVRVIALRYPHTQQPYSYHGVDIYSLGYGAWTRGIRRLRLWWSAWRMVKRLHAEKSFDVLHGIWADETGALSGWLGKMLKIPTVVTIAGGELVGFPVCNYGLQLSQYSRWIVGQALKHNTITVIPSNLSSQLHKTDYTLNRLTHMPLGIDPTMFYPSDTPREPKHLIHVGSLIPVKNQIMLLAMMTLLDDDVTLDIIGEGILERKLKASAVQFDIQHRVNFLGNIPHEELREHYTQAQLHILTSHHEAFGMSIVEAAACGTPTIGTLVGILKDDPALGITINSIGQLVATIDRLLQSEELNNLRMKAIQTVKSNYTIEQNANQYSALYQSLIAT